MLRDTSKSLCLMLQACHRATGVLLAISMLNATGMSSCYRHVIMLYATGMSSCYMLQVCHRATCHSPASCYMLKTSHHDTGMLLAIYTKSSHHFSKLLLSEFEVQSSSS